MKLLLTVLLASTALADTPPVAPPPIKPAGIKCNGEIIPIPAGVQLPISCDEARAYRDGNYCVVELQKCEAKRKDIVKIYCNIKHKSKNKRKRCYELTY